MSQNPLHGWTVDRANIRIVGRDLQRPECILAERGIRIVADGFVGTNEVRLDVGEERLYVVESNP